MVYGICSAGSVQDPRIMLDVSVVGCQDLVVGLIIKGNHTREFFFR